MGLRGDNVRMWEEMKKIFLKEYQDLLGEIVEKGNIQDYV
jgi:hypothetical protein